jgi:hypothetical protein
MLSNNGVDACLPGNKAIKSRRFARKLLAGRERKVTSGADRARVAVTRATGLASEQISKQDRKLWEFPSTKN